MHHNFLKKPPYSTVHYCEMLIRYEYMNVCLEAISLLPPSPILLENIARSKTAGRLLSFLHLHTGSRGYLGNPTNMSRSYLGNTNNMSRSYLGYPTNMSRSYLGNPTNISSNYRGNLPEAIYNVPQQQVQKLSRSFGRGCETMLTNHFFPPFLRRHYRVCKNIFFPICMDDCLLAFPSSVL